MLYRAVDSNDPPLCDHLAQHISSLNIPCRTILFQGFATDSVYPDDFDDDDGCKFEFQRVLSIQTINFIFENNTYKHPFLSFGPPYF